MLRVVQRHLKTCKQFACLYRGIGKTQVRIFLFSLFALNDKINVELSGADPENSERGGRLPDTLQQPLSYPLPPPPSENFTST